MSIYDNCSAAHEGNLQLMMQCISNWVETETVNNKQLINQAGGAADLDDLNNWLLVFAGGLMFMMQAGFAMVCAGAVRKKNVQNS
jgi:hypothetical protein